MATNKDVIERLDKLINLMEKIVNKENKTPTLTFSKANNVENSFIKDRQSEIFKMLDGGDK